MEPIDYFSERRRFGWELVGAILCVAVTAFVTIPAVDIKAPDQNDVWVDCGTIWSPSDPDSRWRSDMPSSELPRAQAADRECEDQITFHRGLGLVALVGGGLLTVLTVRRAKQVR